MVGEEFDALIHDMFQVATVCFDGNVQKYNCLTGNRKDLDDKVIAIARRSEDGKLNDFLSSIIINVPDLSIPVLRCGITCTSPEARGLGLTKKLNSTVLIRFWIQNWRRKVSSHPLLVPSRDRLT